MSQQVSPISTVLTFANHNPTSQEQDVATLCDDVLGWGFAGAFVNPVHVRFASRRMNGRAPVGTIVGFTLGQDALPSKLAAILTAIEDGADELDMYPNTGAFLQDSRALQSEVEVLVGEAKRHKETIVTRIVLEPGLLTNSAQIAECASIIAKAGADFVKIGSGFGPRAPVVEDVRIVRQATAGQVKIKVAGGVRTLKDAIALVEAGATRIGSSSAVRIAQEAAGIAVASPPPALASHCDE